MKVLFLYNNDISLGLYDWLKQTCEVIRHSEKIDVKTIEALEIDLIISYNYKYKISKEVIEYVKGNVVNLHISYLPWNKGVSPNIWSFLDGTPKGVTIHYIDEEIDTGDIIAQKEVALSMQDTLSDTYEQLHDEIQSLFKEIFVQYESWSTLRFKQSGGGTYHSLSDYKEILPLIESWDMKVEDLMKSYELKSVSSRSEVS